MSTIFALFSVENNYDQPKNNLVAWWSAKPDFDTLARACGHPGFPCTDDEDTLRVVNIWQGKAEQNSLGTEYRLEEIKEGEVT